MSTIEPKTVADYFESLRNEPKQQPPVSPFPLEDLLDLTIEWEPVGSRVTCNPPPTDTDNDILCLVEDRKQFVAECGSADFATMTREYTGQSNQSPFTSLRRGDVNLIVTDNDVFYNLFRLATCIAKRRNIMDKADRITLFQHILYGKTK